MKSGMKMVATVLASLAAACSAQVDESKGTSTNDITTTDAEVLTAAKDVSDFGNVIQLSGKMNMFEGQGELALVNASQPGKPIVKVHASGGSMGLSDFDVPADLGDFSVPGTLPEPGDCIAVKNVSGGRGYTDAEILDKAEFGAFVYAHQDGKGEQHPAWATTGPRVYASVTACLADPDRQQEVLTAAKDVSDFGNVIQLTGKMNMFEGQGELALVNASQPGKAIVKVHASGGVMGLSDFDVPADLGDFSVPGTLPAPGDCIAVKNVSGGRGYTDAEILDKAEFGAFVYAHQDGKGEQHPAWATTGPRVYANVAACLADPDRASN